MFSLTVLSFIAACAKEIPWQAVLSHEDDNSIEPLTAHPTLWLLGQGFLLQAPIRPSDTFGHMHPWSRNC